VGGRLFQTTSTQKLEAPLALTVLVDGNVEGVRDADLNDVLGPEARSEITSYKFNHVQHIGSADLAF